MPSNLDGNVKADTPLLDKQEQYWEWWQETRSLNEWSKRRARSLIDIIKSLNLNQPNILDFGCGSGWFTEMLSQYGKTTGIDLSVKAMNAAKQQFPDIDFIGGDLFQHPFPKKHFDLVISQQVISHVTDHEKYLEIAANTLKKDGYFIITFNNKFVLDRMTDTSQFQHSHLGHVENWLPTSKMAKLISKRFNILSKTSIIPMGGRGVLRITNSPKLNKIAESILPREFINSLKERMGLGYINIILAQKKGD